jgi:crotonobetainyl-CoA:carnitine CoA-transferase CaiB-like acyl-CoA transferase
MEHPKYGKVKGIDCPIKIQGAVEGEYTPTPLVGEHTDEVLREILHYPDDKIERIKKEIQAHTGELMGRRVRKML